MEPIQLTKSEARRFLLSHQGLCPPRDATGKDAILALIRRLGCVQFDPLDMVGRNPDLVLQSRVADYRPEMLRELLYEDRLLIDGWDKMMSIYSIEDWPCWARARDAASNGHSRRMTAVSPYLEQVLNAVRQRGPLSSADLDLNEVVDWSWAPTRLSRAALESLYHRGELIVHHKVRSRKVYDLASRHIPARLLDATDPNDADDQYHDWRVTRRIRGVGALWARSGDGWGAMAGIKSPERRASIARLVRDGRLKAISVEGVDEPLYVAAKDIGNVRQAIESGQELSRASFLAPLDNLLWDRRLVEAVFGFRYRWEVYKPAEKREYGYYVLPVLYGERFVARFEPVRDRQSGDLVVRNWWWEPDVLVDPQMELALHGCVERFVSYLGAECVRVASDAASQPHMGWLRGLV